MASVKPPLDKHSQNLTLHCIELQHHKRRMRLMLMAAQHQYGEGGVSTEKTTFQNCSSLNGRSALWMSGILFFNQLTDQEQFCHWIWCDIFLKRFWNILEDPWAISWDGMNNSGVAISLLNINSTRFDLLVISFDYVAFRNQRVLMHLPSQLTHQDQRDFVPVKAL